MSTACLLAFFLLAMASGVAVADDNEIRLSGAVIELNYVGDATCSGCHNPHASNLASLLTHEPKRELCIQCHDPEMFPDESK